MFSKYVDRKGNLVDSDIAKICDAICKAYEATRNINQKIKAVKNEVHNIPYEEDYVEILLEYENIIRDLKKRKKAIWRYRCYLVNKVNKLSAIFRKAWLARNHKAGRSNTSSVSDMMLMTIPTPPTAEAAICRLKQRGMACGMA